jgi:hypothetical protein
MDDPRIFSWGKSQFSKQGDGGQAETLILYHFRVSLWTALSIQDRRIFVKT